MRILSSMQRYPWLTPAQALVLLRVLLAVLFMAHAAVRIGNGSIPRFGAFLESRGWPEGVLLVWLISITELVAGTAMIVGRGLRLASAALAFIAAMGIVIIHSRIGWFVGEHGTGGVEYSLCLIGGLLVVAAAARPEAPAA